MKPGSWAAYITINGRIDAASTFTNMPAANTFLFNSHRHVTMFDVQGMTQVRLQVNKQGTAGFAGSILTLKYSNVFSTAVGDYVDIGKTPVTVAVDTTNTFLDSGWIDIVDDVSDDVFFAVVGSGGNGVLDPQFGSISIGLI